MSQTNIFKNREVKIFTGICLFYIGVSALFCFYNLSAGIAALLVSVNLTAIFLVFVYWRYRALSKLSDYMKDVAAGGKVIDIRDNVEGDLSILKSDIYKVTTMLSTQADNENSGKKMLADSLSDISHQLKTPLTSMTLMAELLENPGLPADKRREFTGRLVTQLERMQWLVSSLLKMSKMDAGSIIMKSEPIDVRALIKTAVLPLTASMEAKDQQFEIKGTGGILFSGDFNWMAEALTNILKNCGEHTPEGGKITVSFEDNPIYTGIYISDTGTGIPKADLPYIFNRFYKGKNSNEESVGIGLAMAYTIIKNHGGDITATNPVDGGALFTIKIYK